MKMKYFLPTLAAFVMFSCGGETTEENTENLNEESTEEVESNEEENLAEEDNNASYTITTNSVGEFKIGELIPESFGEYSIVEKTITIQSEEGPYEDSVHSVSSNGEEVLVITGEYDFITDTFSDKIGEIKIYSDRYKTIEGIGVGSTISEFITAYPDYKLWYTYVGDMYVIETESLDIQFLLDPEGFDGELEIDSDMMLIDAKHFDSETKIESIKMFEPWT